MKFSRTWTVPSSTEKVWEVLTDFPLLAQKALFTKDFVTSEQKVKVGTTFSEIHYFLGRRGYKGIFTKLISYSTWELESHPGKGTGFPVFHKVSYSIQPVASGTLVVTMVEFKTCLKAGKLVDYMLLPFVYLFALDIHHKIKKICGKSVSQPIHHTLFP